MPGDGGAPRAFFKTPHVELTKSDEKYLFDLSLNLSVTHHSTLVRPTPRMPRFVSQGTVSLLNRICATCRWRL
jgi:hypothetical protein